MFISEIKNHFKNISIYEYLIAILPLIIIFRSFSINLFLVICFFVVFFDFNKIKLKIKKYNLIFLYFLFYLFIILNSFFAQEQKSSLISSIFQIKFFAFSLFIFFIKNFKNLKVIFLFNQVYYFLLVWM